jgi:hypothetical protein
MARAKTFAIGSTLKTIAKPLTWSSTKALKISSGKTVQKKLSKLSRHKKYYVQVRAVKTRKNADGKTVTYRGAWSGKKSISTK